MSEPDEEGLTTGSLPDPLEDWWADYARSLRRRGKSDKTAALYRKSYVRFWRWASGEGVPPDPEAVTRELLHGWLDFLRTEPIKDATVAILWRNLRPFSTWWARETDNVSPFMGADNPGEHEDPPDVLAVDDVRALLDTCKGRLFEDRRDTAIVRTLYDTGARLGELAALDVEDWDRRTDFLTLDGKTGLRVVDLSPSTGEAIARYLRLRGKHPHGERTAAMWLGRKGRLSASGVEQLLARRSAQAGLARVHPHQLRHTAAHEFRDQGGSEGDLMYLFGWSSTAMAHRYGRSAAASRARRAHRRLRPGDQL